ncbi:ricin-type beta-trefoil lectin domain protein [Gordonia hankookensis]|uniref:Alpha-galactosidase n=1 Tax=Gordonia hankookensis TaxID=589403 RepID=A0ABR7W7G1_9ACTN|nr:glycoside hydrolase family 27 protein [Gordonia hankookensis]MBD1318540.1 glycoside hydrolase family 27 protein [Gordonia hankookensis]
MPIPRARATRCRLLCVVAVGLVVLIAACTPDPPGRIGGDAVAVAGLPPTPPMGWNSWNTFGCNITEQIVRAQADALVSSGLRDAGYRYVVVDDCWAADQRAADGSLQADPARFPSGMAALGTYLHERGLQFGIYSGASEQTCTQFQGTHPGSTGSRGHEKQDARTFADWQVDYLKYDWCSSDSDHDHQVEAFTAMRDGIRDTGRPILYSINPNSGVSGSVPGTRYDWGGVATMTRVTNDIEPKWSTDTGSSGSQGITDIVDAIAPLAARVRPSSYNDPDMLVVGVDGDPGLTVAEQRTQMSMWAMMAAPLMAGNDLTRMSQATIDILRNRSILAIDQDQRVSAGAPVDNDPEIWARAIGEKGIVVSLTNRAGHPRRMSVPLTSLGLVGDKTVSAVDAWSGRRYQASGGRLSADVGVHDTVVLQIA